MHETHQSRRGIRVRVFGDMPIGLLEDPLDDELVSRAKSPLRVRVETLPVDIPRIANILFNENPGKQLRDRTTSL